MAYGRWRQWVARICGLCLVLTLACNASLPRQQDPTAEAAPTQARATSGALQVMPIVVEVQPSAGSVVGWRQELVIYFNLPMDSASVEDSLNLIPDLAYQVAWKDPAVLTIIPEGDMPAGERLTVTIGSNARSASGINLASEFLVEYTVADNLAVTNQVPAPGADDVDPAVAVMVAFNQPVAPLGSALEFDQPGFRLEPAVDGWGEWVNTSTYIYHPEPALAGGQDYLVVIDQNLVSQAGASFGSTPPSNFGFSTRTPAVTDFSPGTQAPILLDQAFSITFNQAMDPDALEDHLRLEDAGGNPVPCRFSWEDNNSRVTLTPEQRLSRDREYRVFISARAAALGGAMLREDFVVVYRTVGGLAVIRTDPGNGDALSNRFYSAYQVEFNAPLAAQDMTTLVKVTPELEALRISHYSGNKLSVDGDFKAGVVYTVTLSQQITDAWGGTLGEDDRYTFRVLDDPPALTVPGLASGASLLYQPDDQTVIPVSATNINSITVQQGVLAVQELMDLMRLSWDEWLAPEGDLIQWQQRLDPAANFNRTVSINASKDGSPLAPGIYYYAISSPQVADEDNYLSRPFLMVVSGMQVYMKRSAREVFVWLVRNSDLQPASGVPIRFMTDRGTQVGECTTGLDGTCRTDIDLAVMAEYSGYLYAVSGEIGDSDFSLGFSDWSRGMEGWNFGFPTNPAAEEPVIYLYSDRPIYKPGQTVHFRLIAKDLVDGKFRDAPLDRYTVNLVGVYDTLTGAVPTLGTVGLELNEYDSGSAEFTLPADAPPGIYSLQVEDIPAATLQFQVAAYRKPEVDLAAAFVAEDWLVGDEIQAKIQADYFFGAPADRLKVQYTIYASPAYQHLPQDFQAGVETPFWFDLPGWMFYAPDLGLFVIDGVGETDASGSLTVTIDPDDFPPEISLDNLTRLTLEATLSDESGYAVSTRASARLHPAEYAIGLKSERWVGRAGEEMGFLIQTVDWDEQPSGGHGLAASFNRVEWRMRFDPEEGALYEAVRIPVSSADLVTDTAGRARLAFTPPFSGTYEVMLRGGTAVTQRTVWVAGEGQALWPEPPNNELAISSNAAQYRVGDTADIFIPNPFGDGATALLTMERENVKTHQVVEFDGSNLVVALPITEADAPNIFISVVLIGKRSDGQLDFRQGYLELLVNPERQILNISVASRDEWMTPGEEGEFEVTVTDHLGQPVIGDFSMALVDKALLALADPMEPGIVESFYGRRPLRTSTGYSLAAYSGRFIEEVLGKGGGGGSYEPAPEIRSQFEDTAFWRGSFQTDAAGQAVIRVRLPDNLTTWVADVRGLSAEVKVGAATDEVVATKDLLVRPVAPAFLVTGDRVQIAAIVHNNTGGALVADIALEQSGLTLEAGSPPEQRVTIPGGGRLRVGWWAKVGPGEAAELVFSAESGGLSDRTMPESGAIPILRFARQDTFGTSGVLELPGDQVEVIALPRTFDPLGGELNLELAPSLAAKLFAEMDFGEPPAFRDTEMLISDMLPILVWRPVAAELGLDDTVDFPSLSQRVQDDIDDLLRRQHADGGWGWWGGTSNSHLSAYAVLGLGIAMERGYLVPADALARAVSYVGGELYLPELISSGEDLDRQIFFRYAIYRSGQDWVNQQNDIFYQYRSELQPWSTALLVMMMHAANPDDERVQTLISDLAGSAEATATGVFWQDRSASARGNLSSAIFNTATALLALTQADPDSNLVTPAARYLVEQGAGERRWRSSYERSWALMALSETTRVSGEFRADYAYTAQLGEKIVAEDDFSSVAALEPEKVTIPLDEIDRVSGTPLRISRTAGNGRLFYSAFLSLVSAISDPRPVSRGFMVDRRYYLLGESYGQAACPPVDTVQLKDTTQFILARLEVIAPSDRYYVVIEDHFAAGSEAVNLNLKTSQIGSGGFPLPEFDPQDPYAKGWGWWYFSQPQIGADTIRWTAEYLPAGTYTLEYRLSPVHAGSFQVPPAHAYEYFFPDVEGSSAGMVITHLAPEQTGVVE